jgi:hypothetical protein
MDPAFVKYASKSPLDLIAWNAFFPVPQKTTAPVIVSMVGHGGEGSL